MSELWLHPGDPTRPVKSVPISSRLGWLVATSLVVCGILTALGLFAAPGLLSLLVRSADRLALRQTAQRSLEAVSSVEKRTRSLELRLGADELFLARLAIALDVPLPEGFPSPPAKAPDPEAPPRDPERDVTLLSLRLRTAELLRRQVAGVTESAKARAGALLIPSLSPIDPSLAVPASTFGPRISPLTNRNEFFPGILLAAPAGTKVIAPARGTVVFRGKVPSRTGAAWRQLGEVVVLAHGDGMRTVFGNLDRILVRRGQTVKRGEQLASVGQPPWLPSPQLHYEIRRLTGGSFLPVDPRLFILDADWIRAEDLRVAHRIPRDLELPEGLK